MIEASRIWFVCDARHEPPCIYAGPATRRLKSDPLRCIKHGALLFSTTHHDGMTRAQVRRDISIAKGADARR